MFSPFRFTAWSTTSVSLTRTRRIPPGSKEAGSAEARSFDQVFVTRMPQSASQPIKPCWARVNAGKAQTEQIISTLPSIAACRRTCSTLRMRVDELAPRPSTPPPTPSRPGSPSTPLPANTASRYAARRPLPARHAPHWRDTAPSRWCRPRRRPWRRADWPATAPDGR